MLKKKPVILIPEKQALADWRRDLEAFVMRVVRHFIGWAGGLTVSLLGFLWQLAAFGEATSAWSGLAILGFAASCNDEARTIFETLFP